MKNVSTVAALTFAALALGACASWSGVAATSDARSIDAVHAGLTQDEVRSIVGAPDSVMGPFRTGEVVWIYNRTDVWRESGEYDVSFNKAGVVANVSTVSDDEHG